MRILGLDFQMTCGACPEQYDVYLGEEQVGYVRLRHGFLRADYLFSGGETVYESFPEGDGMFDTDAERTFHLTQIAASLIARHTGAYPMEKK